MQSCRHKIREAVGEHPLYFCLGNEGFKKYLVNITTFHSRVNLTLQREMSFNVIYCLWQEVGKKFTKQEGKFKSYFILIQATKLYATK